jgi:hypothetical protein
MSVLTSLGVRDLRQGQMCCETTLPVGRALTSDQLAGSRR